MLLPARVKHRKLHRGRRTGVATQGADLAFGEFGLQVVGLLLHVFLGLDEGFADERQRSHVERRRRAGRALRAEVTGIARGGGS